MSQFGKLVLDGSISLNEGNKRQSQRYLLILEKIILVLKQNVSERIVLYQLEERIPLCTKNVSVESVSDPKSKGSWSFEHIVTCFLDRGKPIPIIVHWRPKDQGLS